MRNTLESSTSISWGRRSVLTGAMMLAGLVLGAASATAVLLANGASRIDGWSLEKFAVAATLGTILGAPIGAVVAPVLGWLLLRDVPLGRAFLWAAVGCIVGSLVGGMVGRRFTSILDGSALIGLLGGALLGVVLTGVLLRRHHRARVQRAAS